ncbi:MAG: ribbon-helix-helix domain-containing protein [Vicinamibacteria bacterium]|nr:ribbon-helix-helix domain-containing protein [Vicinamibacteria bacterium]
MEIMLTIRIDAATQRAIERLARKRRVSRSAVVREALQRFATEEPPPTNKNSAYSKVADLIGSVRSGRGDLSENAGARLRDILTKRIRTR